MDFPGFWLTVKSFPDYRDHLDSGKLLMCVDVGEIYLVQFFVLRINASVQCNVVLIIDQHMHRFADLNLCYIYHFCTDFVSLFYCEKQSHSGGKKSLPVRLGCPHRSPNVLSKIIISSITYQFCLPQTSHCNSTPGLFSTGTIFRTVEGLEGQVTREQQ